MFHCSPLQLLRLISAVASLSFGFSQARPVMALVFSPKASSKQKLAFLSLALCSPSFQAENGLFSSQFIAFLSQCNSASWHCAHCHFSGTIACNGSVEKDTPRRGLVQGTFPFHFISYVYIYVSSNFLFICILIPLKFCNATPLIFPFLFL